jgi:hypothetical protein
MKTSQYYLFGMTLILLLTFVCNGQEKIRKIEKPSVTKEQPIQLVSLEVGDKVLDNENKVLADEDWLKNLELNLKNTSSKTIVYIKVFLQIEAQGKMQHPLRIPLTFGQALLTKTFKSSNDKTIDIAKKLKPNESIKLSIKPSLFDSSSQFIENNEIKDIEKVKVIFDFIVFDDGTAWSQGQWMRRNPDNDKRWDVIDVSKKKLISSQNYQY